MPKPTLPRPTTVSLASRVQIVEDPDVGANESYPTLQQIADLITIGGSGLTAEQVYDAIGAVITAGTGITKTVNDAGDTVTLEVTAGTYASASSITDHTGDTSDAHDASAISVADAGLLYTATDVEAALAEVKTIADAAVTKSTLDANSVLYAVSDNTPAALAVGASTIVGRKATGDVVALTGAEAAAIVQTTLDSRYLSLVAGGSSVENVGAVESNVNTVATTGATETLDVSVYGVHDCTMDQACTFTFSNPAPSGKCSSFVLILRGAFTPTFPASVDWGDATPPTYTTPSMYVFTTVDAGTTWLGSQVGKAFA